MLLVFTGLAQCVMMTGGICFIAFGLEKEKEHQVIIGAALVACAAWMMAIH